MSNIEDIERRLARRLRDEREARTWSLVDLAARSGVSRAMISKIERGEAGPTAALLGRLSAAFGLTLSQLFATTDEPRRGQIARADQQAVWTDPETGFRRRSLSPSGPDPMELVWGELPPGAQILYEASAYGAIADQQLLVISGILTLVRRDGVQTTTHDLYPGDCFRFGPPAETLFRNAGVARCVYVIAILRIAKYQTSPSRA